MAVSWRKDGIYGFVVLDNPPVNAINREIRQGLLTLLIGPKGKGLNASSYLVLGLPLPLALMPRNLIMHQKHPISQMFVIILSQVRYHGLQHCMVRFLEVVRNWRWHAVTV